MRSEQRFNRDVWAVLFLLILKGSFNIIIF